MRILTILLALVLSGCCLAEQDSSKDLDMNSVKKLLDMANLTPPPPRNIKPNNETLQERQEEISSSSSPFLLDESNFHDYVIDVDTHNLILDRPWFLLFYAPWCGFSKNFMPTW